MKLFISPHNDDAALFGAFTLLREKPLVVVVFDSYVQGQRLGVDNKDRRREEDREAMLVLGCRLQFLGFRDDDASVSHLSIAQRILELKPTEVWAPAFEVGGHAQHNDVGMLCNGMPGLHRYLTYTKSGKSRSEHEVPVLDGEWISKKLRALAWYESQHDLNPKLGCAPHFMRDLHEYYA